MPSSPCRGHRNRRHSDWRKGRLRVCADREGMTFDKSANKLTLNGVSPVTVMFSDRPERIAANMRTAEFVPFWSKGKDSFLSDPPNADISILEGGPLRQIVVVLQDPTLQGDNLTYTVRVLQREMPTTRSECRCLSSSQFPGGHLLQNFR